MNEKAINYLKSLKDKKIALIGLGRSHLPLISLFSKYGANIIVCDKRSEEELKDSLSKIDSNNVSYSLGENYLNNIDCDIAFRTPGMKYYSEELNRLRDKNVEITSEMEMFFKLCNCKIIGVTGSDGKTTTTTIISKFLEEQGYNVYLGGNIGKPLLPIIENIKDTDIACVELSSFQLISMNMSPDIAVVTNLQENHLDIHKDMDEYINSKKNIVLYQNENNKAILNRDNDITYSFKNDTKANIVLFSKKEKVNNGCYLSDNCIYYSDNGNDTEIININEIKIPGMHNVENFMTAICAVYGLVDIYKIRKVAKEFSGVEHRAEFVREIDGVRYYNDSIASSPTRTILGTLSLYNEKIVLICGGYDKHLDYSSLGDYINKKVKVLILMGDTAKKIEEATLNSKNYSEDLEMFHAKDMNEAVKIAKDHSNSGDIVSLSPASASFDLYKDFEQRGNHFKEIVNSL